MFLLGARMAAAPAIDDEVAATIAGIQARHFGGKLVGYDPAEMLGLMVLDGFAGTDRFWSQRYVPSGRAMVSALPGHPARFEVELRRHFHPQSRRPAGGNWRLRLPTAIVTPAIRDLTLSVHASRGQVHRRPDRIEVIAPDLDEPLEMTARFAFTSDPSAGDRGSLAESRKWLNEREGAIHVTPAVRSLAAGIAGEESDPSRILRALLDHLIDHMTCAMVQPAWIGEAAVPDWVIAHRWFDCRTGSILLASLCRACGIPARLIGGYLLWAAPMEHHWIEAWLPDRGWTSFDLLAWDLSAGGRDAGWRESHAGAIDHRMITQIFPDRFVGSPGIDMRRPWHRLPRSLAGGTETRFVDAIDARPLFTESVRVQPG